MQNYIMRVFRACPGDMESVSGSIEHIESGQKVPFHNFNELETKLAHFIEEGQLEFPDSAIQELNTHDNVA